MTYEKNFDKGKEDIKNGIIEALEEIGLFCTAEAQLRTPVKTGNLRRSITHKANKDENVVNIGTNVDYAEYVHEGTSKQKAQAFIRDAVIQNINEINNIIKKHLGEVGD